MPQEAQLSHRVIRSANLPYVSNMSPTDTTPCFVPGSLDILTSIKGYAERRPGFSAFIEPVPTTFNNPQRIFTWDRNDGTFYAMFCDINASNQAAVYKMQFGVDPGAQLIYTDTNSADVFDFVVSNNTLYFSNGNVAKKWTPTDGVTNWGISIGSVANSAGPNATNTGSNAVIPGSSSAWANPGNVAVQDGVFAIATLPGIASTTSQGPKAGSIATGWLNAGNVFGNDGIYAASVLGVGATSPGLQVTGFNFGIPTTASIQGIRVEIERKQTGTGSIEDSSLFILKATVASGVNHAQGVAWPTTEAFATYGGPNDLWGTTWTPADINKPGFGINFKAKEFSQINNATALVDFVRITVFYTNVGGGANFSDLLLGFNCGFGVATTNVISGILVEIKGLQNQQASAPLKVQLLKGGNQAGSVKHITLNTTNSFVSVGSSSDLWGTTWTGTDINNSSFGVALQGTNGTTTPTSFDIDFIRITVFGVGGPSVTTATGTLTASNGYVYVFCYGNSSTGHISSPTPQSASIKPSSQGVAITLTASNDPQVNQIHVYRSTDSVPAGAAAGVLFEIPSSPYGNLAGTVIDTAADIALLVANIAPIPTFNDPPPPMRGMVYFSGRLWGFANNKVYFSGLEETTVGVPEESFPSGAAGNFWAFDQAPQGLGVAGQNDSQGLGILCGGRMYAITGNTLDTFRRFTLSIRRGVRNLETISLLGGMMAWRDSSGQIWATDTQTMQEVSVPVRLDLIPYNPGADSMTFHASGNAHWLVLSTGASLLIYDLDTEQWMPPWTVSTPYIYSGETSPGSYQLMAFVNNQCVTLGSGFNDQGSLYTPIIKTNNISMVPDFGTRFSYVAAGTYDEPSRTGTPYYFQVDTNTGTLADVAMLNDDDPLTTPSSSYNSIFNDQTSVEKAFHRNNGLRLVQRLFPMTQPTSRWISWLITGQTADDNLRIYEWYTAYKLQQ